MPLVGPSSCILGVIMVTVIAAETPVTTMNSFNDTAEFNQTSDINNNFESDNTSEPTAYSNTTEIKINITTNVTPAGTSYFTTTTLQPSQPNVLKKKNDSIGIAILVVIILVIIVLGVICYCARKRGRRYSVDFTSRPEETNIPLGTVEAVDTVPQNGLQTFESTETKAQEHQEPETKPLVQEEQKAEADKSVDPSAESAAPAPSADSSEDKPKGDVAEQSPPAPVEPSVEEKTNDEGIVSNETSVDSLKETNENNSNNADVSQKNDWNSTGIFWDVSLDSPV